MATTRTPGMSASHAIITEECLENRGEQGAIDEALDRTRESLEQCVPAWAGKGARFHVVVVIERPGKDGS